MTLLLLGINHKTASVSLREQLSITPDNLVQALNEINALPAVTGVVILSTCNRTEIYCSTHLTLSALTEMKTHLLAWWAKFHGIAINNLEKSFYYYHEQAAMTHLLRVACGLDAMILGEPEIFGQVKKSFFFAKQQKTLSTELALLFPKAFSIVKQIRNRTLIGQNTLSIAFAACTLARQFFDGTKPLRILLIGAGETIRTASQSLAKHPLAEIFIANRTFSRAEKLAQQINASAIHFTDIETLLEQVDIVISSTASKLPIIDKAMVAKIMQQRGQRLLLMIDIAVPRDIAPDVGKLPNIHLYNIDNINDIIQQNLSRRKNAAMQAEILITNESNLFLSWFYEKLAAKNIQCYRYQAEKTRQLMTEQALSAIAKGENVEQVLIHLSHKLTKRLIHLPTKLLQQTARSGDSEKLYLLYESFEIK